MRAQVAERSHDGRRLLRQLFEARPQLADLVQMRGEVLDVCLRRRHRRRGRVRGDRQAAERPASVSCAFHRAGQCPFELAVGVGHGRGRPPEQVGALGELRQYRDELLTDALRW